VGGRTGGTGIAREFLDALPGTLLGIAVETILLNSGVLRQGPLGLGGLLRNLLVLTAIGVLYALGRRVLARRTRRQPQGAPMPDGEDREGAPTRRTVLLLLLAVAVLLLAVAVLLAGVSLGIAVAVVAWLLVLVLAARWARALSDALRDVLVNVAVVSIGGALAIGGAPVVERVAFEARPPRPPDGAVARQITTLDGATYVLKAVGDFTVVELPKADMEVQGRQEARTEGGQRRIVMTALGVRRGGDRIVIRAGPEPELRSNDRRLVLADGSAPLPGKATIERTGKRYRITWTGLAELSVNAEQADSLDFEFVITAPESERGAVRGLGGNADGDQSNDLSTPQGKVFPQPAEGDAAAQAQIDGPFADSWRVPPGVRRLLD
jgi:hypothetical protein